MSKGNQLASRRSYIFGLFFTLALAAALAMPASIAFALAHVALYQAFDLDSELALWGLAFGAVHWLVAGMALGMMPMLHPRIKEGTLMPPGAFAMDYPMATMMGFLMLHLMFGILVGVFYDVFGGV